MRTTVGPLPSAVYWRRRAILLGAVLLGIIVLIVNCSGSGDDKHGNTASSKYPTPAPASNSASDSPSDEPSFSDGVPGNNGPSLPDPNQLQSQQATTDTGGDGATTTPTTAAGQGQTTGTNTNVTAPADGSCSDAMIQIVPVPQQATLKRGASVVISLQIKNISTVACSRDVGATPQELYLNQGARKYWSSDDCGSLPGTDVRKLASGAVLTYKVTWNGRQSSTCSGSTPNGPTPPAGQFQLFGRLGTMVSNPVAITFQS